MAQPKSFSFDLPDEYSTQARDIQRRQQMADMLQQQAQTPLETNRMAGGYVVPIHPLEGLAKLMAGMQARSERKGADEQAVKLAQLMQQNRADTIQRAIAAGQPAPAIEAPSEGMGGGPGRPAMPGNPRAAYDVLAQSKDPMLSQMGFASLLKSLEPKSPIKLGKDDTLVDPNTFRPVYSPTPQTKFHTLGPGQSLVPEPTAPGAPTQPALTIPERSPEAIRAVEEAMRRAGIDPQSPEAQGLFRNLVNKQTTHQPAPSATAIATAGPKAFETELGKQDAEKLAEWRKNAELGQQMLTTAANMRDAIKRGVFSGGGADLKTEAANLISGLTGTPIKSLPGSQLFNAEASNLVLDRVKLLGANPSNADREFIEKTVPRLSSSPEARDQLIAFLERKAQSNIDLFRRADSHARQNRGLGGFDYFQPSGSPSATQPAVPPPPPGFQVVPPGGR